MMKKTIFIFILFVAVAFTVAGLNSYEVVYPEKWHSEPLNDLMQSAKVHYDEGDFDQALVMYNYIANVYDPKKQSAEDIENSLLAMYNVGHLYQAIYSNYNKAYSYLNRALKESLRLGNKQIEAYCYNELAILYDTEDNIDKKEEYADSTIKYLRKAFNLALEINDQEKILHSIVNMTTLAYGGQRIKDIKKDAETFLKLNISDSLGRVEASKNIIRGILNMNDGNYNEALSSFFKLKQSDNISDQIFYYANSGECYFHMNNEKKAIAMLDSLKDIIREQHDLELLMQTCDELYKYHTHFGNEREALANRLEYFEIKNEIERINDNGKIKEMKLMAKIDEANANLKDTINENRNQRNILIAMIVIIVLLLTVVVTIVCAYYKLKINHRQLYNKNVDLLAQEEQAARDREHLISLIEKNEKKDQEKQADEKKYGSSLLTEEAKDNLYIKIRHAMNDTELICSENFSVGMLAEIINERQRNVSQVINEKAGVNFPTFLNEYRIKEACRRINDPENFGHLTLAAIADSVGIKARSQFTSMFKRIIGMTPSEYIRIAREQKK